VLIPAYNYARFLPEAVESVLQQDFEDFELIIADDASTDDTAEVCTVYVQRDSRICFVRHEKNLGMVENWNWCLRKARGKYIKFLLADDRLERPYALTKLVDALRNPEVFLVASARNLMDETSRITGRWNPLGVQDVSLPGRKLILRCLDNDLNMIGEPSAVLFRAVDATRGFSSEYRQLTDLEMWFHLLQRGSLSYIAEPLCSFRRHSLQQTETNRKSGLHWYEMSKLIRNYLGDPFVRKSAFFRQLHRIRKHRPELKELAEQLQAEFSLGESLFFMVRFKILRFFRRIIGSGVRRIRGADEKAV
jgi:glycosyltransferase involved in cell wall biosynthesis